MRFAIMALALILAAPFSLSADDRCSGDVAALRALYDIRQLMLGRYGTSYELQRRIEASLNELRDPLRDGGYRWVRYVRPTGDGPIIKEGHLVSAVHGGENFDSFEASGTNPFSVRVVVPRKRSLTKNNKELYVSDVEIRYWVNGERKTQTRRIDQWMNPDTSRTFDLDEIAERAEVRVHASTRSANRREALVEVHFRQAVAQDDPANPAFEGIEALKRVASSTTPLTIDTEIARFEKRLFPSLVSTPYTSLVLRLREAEKLVASEKEEDQEKGKKMLTEVSRNLGQFQ